MEFPLVKPQFLVDSSYLVHCGELFGALLFVARSFQRRVQDVIAQVAALLLRDRAQFGLDFGGNFQSQ